jgi:hypothetical protein
VGTRGITPNNRPNVAKTPPMTSTTRPASGMTRPSSLGIRPISAETRPTWPVDRGIAQAIRPGPRSSRPLFLPTPVASPPATACALPLSPSHRSWQSSYRPPQWTPAYDRPGSLRHPPIASVETTRHFFSSYFRLFLSTFSPCPVPRSRSSIDFCSCPAPGAQTRTGVNESGFCPSPSEEASPD